MSLLGIDVGLRGCRALAVSQDGVILADVGRGFGSSAMEPPCELDVRQIWDALVAVLTEAASLTLKDPISALGIASVGEAVTPVSKDGRVLAACLAGQDPRGREVVADIVRELGPERFHDITGRVPGPSHTLSKLCWLMENEPSLYRETWRFVLVGGLVSHLLGGSTTCDYSLAAGTLLFDTRHKTWSREVLSETGLSPAKLPDLAQAGSPIGVVASGVARRVGLPSGVRIILGGLDRACKALGLGVVHTGMSVLDLGAAARIIPVFQAVPLISIMLRHGLGLTSHVVPDRFLTDYDVQAGGSLLRWFAHEVTPSEYREATKRGVSPYRLLLEEMPANPTSLMVIPPGSHATQTGAMMGLTLATSRGELIKGLLEGVSYELARGQAALEQTGIPIDLYRATGGGARSDRWLQLAADVLGRPIELTATEHAAALGAALVAGVGTRVFSDHDEGVQALVTVARSIEPDLDRHATYTQRITEYGALYDKLANTLSADSR